jgi:hypothetical protein
MERFIIKVYVNAPSPTLFNYTFFKSSYYLESRKVSEIQMLQ